MGTYSYGWASQGSIAKMPREIDELLGLDETLAVEASVVTVRVDQRRYGKNMTLVEGFDPAVDVKLLTKELKNFLGTGGTLKDGVVELQGDHREKVKGYLRQRGYTVE